MNSRLFYTPAMIASAEQAVRIEFAKFAQLPQNRGVNPQCYARMGRIVGPAITRAALAEQNIDTPSPVVTSAINQIAVWAILRRIDGVGATHEQMIEHVKACCNEIGDSAIASIEAGAVRTTLDSPPPSTKGNG